MSEYPAVWALAVFIVIDVMQALTFSTKRIMREVTK